MRVMIEIVIAALLVSCITACGSCRYCREGIERCLRRRQGPDRRWPELLIQRPGKCLARRALRGDPKAMRRKIFRQLSRRQAVVGDVSFRKNVVVPASE